MRPKSALNIGASLPFEAKKEVNSTFINKKREEAKLEKEKKREKKMEEKRREGKKKKKKFQGGNKFKTMGQISFVILSA